MSFADLGVSRAVSAALDARGINEPFAIQKLVIADVLAGRDVLAQSPTGSGKTLAFGIPMVDMIEANDPRPAALVLAPTRELVSQIVEELRPLAHARALKIASVYGGVGIQKQAREAGRAQIVVATPGRLEDLLDRRAFRLDRVKLLVLDEADRMLDMGFRPAVDRIVALCPAKRQTLFFSATLEGEAGKAARSYTSNDAVKHSHAPSQRKIEAIEHRFVKVERDGRLDELVRALRSDRSLTLVFVRTKRGADRLVKRLSAAGVESVAMHGDKSQAQREKALARFGSGRVDTLIATDVAARGIDVAGISHVINFDPPEDSDTYVHRTGRTGRAGRTGVGITFFGAEQAYELQKIAHGLKLGEQFARSGHVSGGGGESGDRRRGGHSGTGRPRKPMAGSVRGSGPRPGGGPGGPSKGGGGYQGKKKQGSRRAKASARDGGGSGGGSAPAQVWSSDGRARRGR